MVGHWLPKSLALDYLSSNGTYTCFTLHHKQPKMCFSSDMAIKCPALMQLDRSIKWRAHLCFVWRGLPLPLSFLSYETGREKHLPNKSALAQWIGLVFFFVFFCPRLTRVLMGGRRPKEFTLSCKKNIHKPETKTTLAPLINEAKNGDRHIKWGPHIR